MVLRTRLNLQAVKAYQESLGPVLEDLHRETTAAQQARADMTTVAEGQTADTLSEALGFSLEPAMQAFSRGVEEYKASFSEVLRWAEAVRQDGADICARAAGGNSGGAAAEDIYVDEAPLSEAIAQRAVVSRQAEDTRNGLLQVANILKNLRTRSVDVSGPINKAVSAVEEIDRRATVVTSSLQSAENDYQALRASLVDAAGRIMAFISSDRTDLIDSVNNEVSNYGVYNWHLSCAHDLMSEEADQLASDLKSEGWSLADLDAEDIDENENLLDEVNQGVSMFGNSGWGVEHLTTRLVPDGKDTKASYADGIKAVKRFNLLTQIASAPVQYSAAEQERQRYIRRHKELPENIRQNNAQVQFDIALGTSFIPIIGDAVSAGLGYTFPKDSKKSDKDRESDRNSKPFSLPWFYGSMEGHSAADLVSGIRYRNAGGSNGW